jgi:glycosyltransferase involved in cell wall biosynthesis
MQNVSIVVPVHNEADNIATLVAEILETGAAYPLHEIIFVDDASTDHTQDVLSALQAEEPRIIIVTHPNVGGQSAAIHSGVLRATGTIIAMLDGDGQNPPFELPKLVAPLLADTSGNLALVAGQRVGRRDTLSKRLASQFANKLRSALLKDGTRDTGCGLKAFRRDAFLVLPVFNHMHRYLPALFIRDGWDITHVDVSHRERGAGRSKYNNFQRGLVGIFDLIGVSWLIRRRKRVNKMSEVLRHNTGNLPHV